MHAMKTRTSDLAFTRTPEEIVNAIFNCDVIQMRIILVAIGLAVRTQQSFVSFSLDDYTKITKLDIKGGARQRLLKSIEDYVKLPIKFEDDERAAFVNWFDYSAYNKKTKMIELNFSQFVYPYLEQLEKYTVIESSLYSKLSSTYAIRWYLNLKSYRTTGQSKTKRNNPTWEMKVSTDEIRNSFNIDDTRYEKNKDLVKYVVNKPVQNLNEYNKEFTTETNIIKDGNKITGVSFTCTDIKITPSIPVSRNDSIAYKNQKLEINKERDDLNAKAFEYKKRADWQEIHDKIYAESKYEFISEETKELLVTADTVQYFDNLLSETNSAKSK